MYDSISQQFLDFYDLLESMLQEYQIKITHYQTDPSDFIN